ncbi:MAG: hypothetical protein ACFFA8_00870 [Promethearchaeota archaeon]
MGKSSNNSVLDKNKKEENSSWKIILISEKPKSKIKYRSSLLYAIIINTLIIVGIILTISILTIIGGIWINPALIFGIMIILVLFSVLEGLNLIQKEIDLNNKDKGENPD